MDTTPLQVVSYAELGHYPFAPLSKHTLLS